MQARYLLKNKHPLLKNLLTINKFSKAGIEFIALFTIILLRLINFKNYEHEVKQTKSGIYLFYVLN